MNSKEIFKMALGLEEPWQIDDIRFTTENGKKVLEISLGFKRGHRFIDPESRQACGVHDTLERTWRHLNFFEHECYLKCSVPRIRTLDGKVKQVSIPWAREGSGFTLLFEAFSMLLIESEMPVNKVGKVVNEYPNRIWTFFRYWVSIAYAKADHSGITRLGIDETSAKKRHNYITVGVDMDNRSVIHATEGKGADTITAIKEHLEQKGTTASEIDQVCIDLSPSFISGVVKEFPDAAITFDRFHVKKLLNKAMDEVRKKERRSHELLKGHRYTFLMANSRLSQRLREQRDALIDLYPVLGEAYRLKELFDDFWEMDNVQDAAGFLAFWCDQVHEAGIQPFIKFSNTIKAHWSGIVNYIESRMTNGILEGINSKIQLIKARARGFRNTSNFISMIYFNCGKLNFDYPQYLA